MNMDIKWVELLKKWGLNSYEAKAYLALILNGPLTASTISSVANIPRPRVYDVLESLQKKGLVISQPGRPVKFLAISLREGAENIKKIELDAFEKRIAEIEDARDKLIKTLGEGKTSVGGYDLWILHGKRNIYNKIKALIDNATQDIVISVPSSDPEKFKFVKPLLKKASERGVKIKLIGPYDIDFGEVIKRDHEHRFLVADDHAIIYLAPPDKAAWIKSEYFSQRLKELFD